MSTLEPLSDDPLFDYPSACSRQKMPLVVVHGRPGETVCLGRGGNATVRVGKRDRQVSRVHARIDFLAELNEYELEVVGMNGLTVDQVPYRQHERTLLKHNATIHILGTQISFIYHPPQPVADEVLAPEKENMDHVERIIRACVYSRKSSMLASDICSCVMKQLPQNSEPVDIWQNRVETVLKSQPFFGEIVRKGNTADGSAKENLYYYNSAADPVDWRRAKYTQVGRSARKCTLEDKQYFWKVPPKLNSVHLGTKRPAAPKES